MKEKRGVGGGRRNVLVSSVNGVEVFRLSSVTRAASSSPATTSSSPTSSLVAPERPVSQQASVFIIHRALRQISISISLSLSLSLAPSAGSFDHFVVLQFRCSRELEFGRARSWELLWSLAAQHGKIKLVVVV